MLREAMQGAMQGAMQCNADRTPSANLHRSKAAQRGKPFPLLPILLTLPLAPHILNPPEPLRAKRPLIIRLPQVIKRSEED